MRKIPDYSKVKEQLARYREAVFRKMLRGSGFSAQDVQSKIKEYGFDKEIDKLISGKMEIGDETWPVRRDDCARYSSISLNDDQKRAFDAAAGDITLFYTMGFVVRAMMLMKSPFSDNNEHDRLVFWSPTDIYLNHVTREAFSQLTAFGLTPRSTISAVNFLIRGAISSYYAISSVRSLPANVAIVRPMDDYRILSSRDADGMLATILPYWEKVRNTLNDRNEEALRADPMVPEARKEIIAELKKRRTTISASPSLP